MKVLLFVVGLISMASCQKYVCHCEGMTNDNSLMIVNSSKQDYKKATYSRAELKCMKKGLDINQKCYILLD